MNIKKPIVFFDIESTGLDTDRDQIIQLSLHKLTPDGKIERKEFFIMPDVEICNEAKEVHGITKEMLVEKGAPKLEVVAKDVFEYIKDCALAGYNIKKFDIPMLENELNRVGIEVDFSEYTLIDVQQMYRKHRPHNLVSAFEDITTKSFEDNAHDASADVDATIAVCAGIMMPKSPDVTLEDFANEGDQMVDYDGKFLLKDGEYVFNFGKDFGNPVKNNVGLLYWMLNKDFKRNTKTWARRFIEMYG